MFKICLTLIITLFSCAIFYYKTLKVLKKYEKEFANEIEKLEIKNRSIVLENSKIASQVLTSYNKTI